MKMNLPTLIAATVVAGAAFLGTAQADNKSPLAAADQKFVKEAAQSGASEVKVAELAVKKAENSEVKTLAETVIKHHTELNTELATVAKAKGVELSSTAPAAAADTVQTLEQQSGKNFDKEFLQNLIASHKKSIKNYEAAAEGAQDAELKAWANKNLPTLKLHLDQATALEAKY